MSPRLCYLAEDVRKRAKADGQIQMAVKRKCQMIIGGLKQRAQTAPFLHIWNFRLWYKVSQRFWL